MDSKLTSVFGWWDWDADAPAIVNRVTKERVAFRGRFQNTDLVPSDESWMRFDYLHPELRFPLLARERRVDLSRGGIKSSWTVDYEKSATLWRRETQPSALVPSYGAWRRIDDCTTDALACWPEAACVSEPLLGSVVFRGGWLNGRWEVEWQRRYDSLPGRIFSPSTPVELYPSLYPFDGPPPSRWLFHPFAPHVEGGETASLEAQIALKGLLIEGKGSQRRIVLPAETPLDTLEGRTVYLLTEDGRRLFYPMAGETDPARGLGHSSPMFRLIYVDEEIVCELHGRPLGTVPGSIDWRISPAPASLGYRSRGDTAEKGHSEWVFSAPFSRPYWLRIQWASFDAWSQWRGTTARSPMWLDGLQLRGADAVTVGAGYRGGQLVGNLGSAAVFRA